SSEQAEQYWQQEQERIQKDFDTASRSLTQEWKQTVKEALDTRSTRAERVDEKAAHALLTNELDHRARLKRLDAIHADNIARLKEAGEGRAKELSGAHA